MNIRVTATHYNLVWVTIDTADTFAIEAATEFGLTFVRHGFFLDPHKLANLYTTDRKTAKLFAAHCE